MNARILPSILTADFARLADAVAVCVDGGADGIHLDVMDGQFVPNLTFGAKVIEAVRSVTDLPLDVHMMVVQPEKYFDDFAAAGASGMTIHVEAAPHLHRQLYRIKELGCAAGVAVNPGTALDAAREVVAELDLLLVMSVNPGFGGQHFIRGSLDKLRRARMLLAELRSPAALEVDGGINRGTLADAWRSGADTFVIGNAVFAAADPRAELRALRALCQERA